MVQWVVASFFAGGFIAFTLGYFVGRLPLTPDDVYHYMSRVVSLEAIEEQERLTKLRMARNQRKTTRIDGGPNARITKMRLKPGMVRRKK